MQPAIKQTANFKDNSSYYDVNVEFIRLINKVLNLKYCSVIHRRYLTTILTTALVYDHAVTHVDSHMIYFT